MKEMPRLRFAHLPTAIEELPRLTQTLGGPRLLVKRDDQTGLAFGGNKTRKLEFLAADALAKGAKTLISAGAVQSNHCRQTAAAAARLGLKCTLVLTGKVPEIKTANVLLDHLFGAHIVWVEDRAMRDQVLQSTYENAVQAGENPYLVPYGGSSPVGALGYVFAVQELMQQQVQPDWIVFGTSSGGTHAGLMLGARLFGYTGKILGISIDEPQAALQQHVAHLAAQASQVIGKKITFKPDDILATDSYCQAGYGVFGDAEHEAISLFARLEGLLLDPVYTGRAAAGMIDLVRRGYFSSSETVLFWHTGGQPALFAEQYIERIL